MARRIVSRTILAAAVGAYHKAQKHRLRPVQLLRIGSIVFAVAMMVLGIALQSPLVLLFAVPLALLLYVFSPTIWNRLGRRLGQ